MDKDTRNAIERATQRARKLLEDDFASQLEGTFDVLRDGTVAPNAGSHLSPKQTFQRDKIITAIEHKRAASMSAADAVADYLRDAAFTTLNRFVALKMLEARELVQECITEGEQSAGYREFCGLASGIALLPESAGYRLYIESLFDELSTEVKVLFDRRGSASVLWPKRTTFAGLLDVLNGMELANVWGEDETIGWVYQYFNFREERAAMRDTRRGGSRAPRTSRELAIRNQFFTPRYVAKFLTDNTLGRIWTEMRRGNTALQDVCAPTASSTDTPGPLRASRDPRDIRVLDPACGSGHFLLCAFDLLVTIYLEAWQSFDERSPPSEGTGGTLRHDYSSESLLRAAIPGLILQHNIFGVDIDRRCAQIAQLALWMRAQRAYRDFAIPRADRPPILRANIVTAEPLLATPDVLHTFINRLGNSPLAEHFQKLFTSLSLAGELGLLLQVETLAGASSTIGQSGSLFAAQEEKIREALHLFAVEGLARQRDERRLFVDDALAGVGLLEVATQTFDVVLMNPPFGLLTDTGQEYISDHYQGAHGNAFAAFVRRARMLCPHGLIGAITSNSFLVTKPLEAFRREDVVPRLRYLWDLGLGVMDAASVESAAFVLGSISTAPILAADGRGESGPDPSVPRDWISVRREDIMRLPLAKILYDLPSEVHRILSLPYHLEPNVGTAREGMKSFDNERFVRLCWEVEPHQIGTSWRRYAKGGHNVRIGGRQPLVLRYHRDGAELDEKNRQINGGTAQVRQASTYWFRPGVTYSRRATEFAPRALPAGYVFSAMGPAVLSTSNISAAYLLGWLNSRAIRYLVHLQAHKQQYLTGPLKKLPWIQPSGVVLEAVEGGVNAALRAWLEIEFTDEASPYFCGPGRASSPGAILSSWTAARERLDRLSTECFDACDRLVDALYGVDSDSWGRVRAQEDEEDSDHIDGSDDGDDAVPQQGQPVAVTKLVSWAVGVALGRWGVDSEIVGPSDAFAVPPARPPAELASYDGDVVLPDDAGHPRDLARRACEILARHCEVDTSEVVSWFDDVVGPDGVRQILGDARSPTGLWRHHVDTHSAHRRKAPVMWRLGVPSGRYSLWVNGRRASRDTLYQALQLVEPKLQLEESRLRELQLEATREPASSSARATAGQQGLIDELRHFREELLVLAPLWAPTLSDGALVCLSPLRSLMPFDRTFQAELEEVWEHLVAGRYDWAHLAMHLWPERVVPKCVDDRSLAVAHDLDEVLWGEGRGTRSSRRDVPTTAVADLIAARTSPAVKEALRRIEGGRMSAPNGQRSAGNRVSRRANRGDT